MSAGQGKTRRQVASRPRTRAVEALEPRRLFSSAHVMPAVQDSSSTPGFSGFTPTQILHAYGFDAAASNIGAVGGTGAGQTIAIVEAFNDPTILSDLHQFDAAFGIADPPALIQLNQSGNLGLPSANKVWSSETALDVEWAHAVAPDAQIVIVEARTDSLSDLLTAVETAKNLPDVSVVSMSWGVNEFAAETQYDGIFTTPAGHVSETFVASSGDSDSALGVQWPAASPAVVSVGGSTLTSSAAGGAETASSAAISGVSQYESAPTYQTAAGNTPAGGASAQGASGGSANRSTPDVVYNASAQPGFAIYDTSLGGWSNVGGTSAGAPQWAALVAIANQVRNSAGQSTLDGATQTLPVLYQYYKKTPSATVAPAQSLVVAGTLTSTQGAPQASFVIGALAVGGSGTKAAKARAVASLAALRALRAKPFVVNFPVHPPTLSLQPRPLAAGIAVGAVARSAPGMAVIAPADRAGLSERISSGAQTPLAPGSLAQALLDAVAAAGQAGGQGTGPIGSADDLLRAAAAFYLSARAPAVQNLVTVGTGFGLATAAREGYWYIAHVDLAVPCADAMSQFIAELTGVALSPAARNATPHHARAWLVTALVFVLDVALLNALRSRRKRGTRRSIRSQGAIPPSQPCAGSRLPTTAMTAHF